MVTVSFLPPGDFRSASEISLVAVRHALRGRRSDLNGTTQLVRGVVSNMREESGTIRFDLAASPFEKRQVTVAAELTQAARGALEAELPHPLGELCNGLELVAYARIPANAAVPLPIEAVVGYDSVEGYGDPDYRKSIKPSEAFESSRIRVTLAV